MKTSILIALFIIMFVIPTNIEFSTIGSIDTGHGIISIAFDDGRSSTYDYAFPILAAHDMTATYYVLTSKLGSLGFMGAADLIALQDAGNEIGSHGVAHPVFPSLTSSQIRYECSESKSILESLGLVVKNFAYPYGDGNLQTDAIASEYYRSARRAYVPPYIMETSNIGFSLTGYAGERGDNSTLDTLKSIVDSVHYSGGWAIIFFHNLTPQQTSDQFSITVSDFSGFLDYISYKKIPTVTVDEALDLFAKPTPTSTPFPTIVPISTPEPQPTSHPSPTASETPAPTSSPSLSPTPISTPFPTIFPSSTPQPTLSPTATPLPDPSPQPTSNPLPIASSTPIPTNQSTSTISPNPTSSPIFIPMPSGYPRPTISPTPYPEPITSVTPTPIEQTSPKETESPSMSSQNNLPAETSSPSFPFEFLADNPHYGTFLALIVAGIFLIPIILHKKLKLPNLSCQSACLILSYKIDCQQNQSKFTSLISFKFGCLSIAFRQSVL
jgi:peptidoglycan/xylan/chitin deacetylase (PgdA/CDA1 family)